MHIADTPIWCDAARAREVCFVSSAHAIEGAHRGQLLGTATTLAMLPASGREQRGPETRLPVPYDRPFTLGTRRLELIRSGYAAGSAGLSITVDQQRILYAGAIGRGGIGLGGEPDCRPCDVLVLNATFGEPKDELPPPAQVAAHTISFVRDVTSRGGVAVLLLSTAAMALEALAQLAAAEIPAAGHVAFARAARRARAAGVVVPALRRASGGDGTGGALLWPADARSSLDAVPLPADSRIALVAGEAARSGAVRAIRADAGFAWSSEADFRELVAYVEGAGAEQVYTTGAGARRFADAIRRPGRPAEPLAPPEQLPLF